MIRFEKLKNFLKKKRKYILFVFIFSLVCFFGIFLIMRNFTISGACDTFFIAGALLIGLGILQGIANYGTFDLLSFSTSKFFDSYKHEPRYKDGFDLLDYKESKKNKRTNNRWNFLFFEILGILYLIGAIISRFLI